MPVNTSFDLVIIGSGPGGYRAAVLAALRGLRVAIVERRDWGGCCLNRGCVPKKAWYHTAQTIAHVRQAATRGLRGEWQLDFRAVWDHQERVVKKVQDSYIDYMARLGIVTFEGHASLQGATQIRVDGSGESRLLEARHIVLATGSRVARASAMPLTPNKIISTDMLYDLPPPTGTRVAVVGGGVIATEFAFILSMLGRDVVWLTRRDPLASSRFSPPALSVLKAALKQYGIEPRIGAEVADSKITEAGVRLTLSDGQTLQVDWMLLAAGRIPYTENLGLASAGIRTDGNGYIAVNDYLQTDASSVYAIGDCVGPTMTANQALADAAIAIDNILGDGNKPRATLWVPEVVYSAIELARVGMNEDAAEDAELEPAIGFASFETSPCALGQDDPRGFVRLIGDMDSGGLLGGEIVGTDAGELVHLLSTASSPDTILRAFAHGRFNHPARAEELLNATETLASKWNLMDRIFAD